MCAQAITVRNGVQSGNYSLASLNSFRIIARWCTGAQDTDVESSQLGSVKGKQDTHGLLRMLLKALAFLSDEGFCPLG